MPAQLHIGGSASLQLQQAGDEREAVLNTMVHLRKKNFVTFKSSF